MNNDQLPTIKALLDTHCPNAIATEDMKGLTPSLTITADKLVEVCSFLYENEACYFDLLSCLTGIDNGESVGTMEVVYQLYSIPYEHSLTLRVVIDRQHPLIDTVSHIWRTADWHEREAYDLLGIRFNNHPDLRRILLPEDWEGFPLRKDYRPQETYHGIKVD